ncbi:cell envelope integrity protein TolA [Gilliamella sp. B2881]|uniref:cell envelope integrity protein TolA n=1 Tax=Gilliamella sp. B2881 TaxID=2817976 RepID=UPI002269D9EF|nr:cell envelope integrity protein TolA [Gilliamella sp. B2881]MCX8694637.1 cell envelope integrity protein TolA [Gilliamella sp. B2881]
MRNSKLSIPIIISIILHLILIIILGYQAMQEKDSVDYGKETGNSIDAIMIDPSVMSDQHQRHLKTKESQQQADKKREQQVADQAKELQEKQLAEQQYLKDLTKERIKIAEQLKQQEAERIAAEKAAAERVAAERAAAEKAAAEKAAAEKAAVERAAAEKARQKAEQAKKDKALNDLLGGLTSGSPNSPSNLSGAAASRRGSSDDELAKYKALVTNAISNKFINPANVYSGKSCVLQIQIAPDGLLLNVAASGGDDALCREAVAATKLATIPKPAIGLYDKVKKMIVEFQPK